VLEKDTHAVSIDWTPLNDDPQDWYDRLIKSHLLSVIAKTGIYQWHLRIKHNAQFQPSIDLFIYSRVTSVSREGYVDKIHGIIEIARSY
jgi:hypothetical protein